ncbi:MAG: hypothetical protein N2170_07465 [Bacteroidia bacterium]|nr:hypothetical protein [Bacteroidia bacterium]
MSWLQGIRGVWTFLSRFYPLQLPLFQLRRHFFLTLLWIALWLIAFGEIGQGLGVPELFYDPRSGPYPTWGTTFVWGAAYGLFVIAYHLTTYLLDGHHAGFLLREPYPFFQYTINNSVLPVSFWIYYLHRYTQYHVEDPNLVWQILGHFLGLLFMSGALLSFLSFSSQDFFRLKRYGLLPPQRLYQQVVHAGATPTPVRYYIAWPKGIQATDRGLVLDKRSLSRLLFQHHRNAFLLEFVLLGLIAGWGYFQGWLEVYMPASAAFLVLWAILYMMGGALSFWLRQWGGWAVLSLVVIGIFLARSSWFKGYSQAYGLSYRTKEAKPVPPPVSKDSLSLVRCLDGWVGHQGGGRKPLVWIQVSGGGWRSAFWTLGNLQLLDSMTSGKLWNRAFAISGASGGLIGAAVWRELGLYYPHRKWDLSEPFSLTQDALNPILSTGLVGLLSPPLYFRDSVTGERYVRGRGYAFEQTLIRSARAFYGRRLGDYAEAEQQGRCPLLFITPTLLPIGRQLLISPQPCSPLTRDGLMEELRRCVGDADELYLTTALRMNASFPFVLPPVELPTQPVWEAIDAGAIDNFGELVTLRFLWEMRKAIAERASRVVIIEIRDLPEDIGYESEKPASIFSEFFRRLGGLYSSFAGARQLFTRMSYEVLRVAYPIPVEKYILAFRPRNGRIPPLGFSLRPADQRWMFACMQDSLHMEKIKFIQKRLE